MPKVAQRLSGSSRVNNIVWPAEASTNASSDGPEPVELARCDDQAQVPWGSLWKGPQHVVFGHNASQKLQTWPCATGLDTGCCYGNQLTALIIPNQKAKQAGNGDTPVTAADADDAGPEKHVTSLSDLDASLVLVPAKKAYSEK